jgi:signal transduction histidine kinase
MSDEALISSILHDLAGMMTSVQGLAQIVETRRDHPSIDEFLSMLSSESEKAATAVKDIQLIRALADGQPVEDIQTVTVSELFLAIREALSEDLRHGFTPPPPGLPDVVVDKMLIADLIARVYAEASQTNPAEEHHVSASVSDGSVNVTVDLGPPEPGADIMQGIRSGRKSMRPAAIAYRLLPRWNGVLEPLVGDDSVRLVFRLPTAA